MATASGWQDTDDDLESLGSSRVNAHASMNWGNSFMTDNSMIVEHVIPVEEHVAPHKVPTPA